MFLGAGTNKTDEMRLGPRARPANSFAICTLREALVTLKFQSAVGFAGLTARWVICHSHAGTNLDFPALAFQAAQAFSPDHCYGVLKRYRIRRVLRLATTFYANPSTIVPRKDSTLR